MEHILKARRAFQRANKRMATTRDQALDCGDVPTIPALAEGVELITNHLRSEDGTNARLYSAAVRLKEAGVYSPASATKVVALALLKRIHKANGFSWEYNLKTFAPEWV